MVPANRYDDVIPCQWYVTPSDSPSRSTYWRRRLVVIAVAVALLVVLAGRVGSALGGVPASAPERRPAPVTYTVRPGDTMWSIAAQLQPTGDQRELVAELMQRNGGDVVHVGQQLVVPAARSG